MIRSSGGKFKQGIKPVRIRTRRRQRLRGGGAAAAKPGESGVVADGEGEAVAEVAQSWICPSSSVGSPITGRRRKPESNVPSR